jgi:hypothetical protein
MLRLSVVDQVQFARLKTYQASPRFGGAKPVVYGNLFHERDRFAVSVYFKSDVLDQLKTMLGEDGYAQMLAHPRKGAENAFTVKTGYGPVTLKAAYRPKNQDVLVYPDIPVFFKRPYLRVVLDKAREPHHLLVQKDYYNLFGMLLRRTPVGYILGADMAEDRKSSTQRELYRIYLYQNALIRRGRVPHKFIADVLEGLMNHTPAEIKRFIRWKSQVQCVDRVIDVRPDLAKEKIPLCPRGDTYKSARGVYSYITHQVVVAQRSWSSILKRYTKCYDVANTTSHELGHARDDIDYNFSMDRRFALAYGRDLAAMSPKNKKSLADWIGVGVKDLKTDYAKGEVYAQVYADLKEKRQHYWGFNPLKALNYTVKLMRQEVMPPA